MELIRKTKKNEDLSILVVGYDGYKDVWEHFVYFINKYWTERPKTYFATSELEPDYENIEIVKAGANTEWSRKAFTALSKIKTKYVLLLLEDFFITDYVDNNEIENIIEFIKEKNIKFYQLTSHEFCSFFDKIKNKSINEKKYIHILNKKKRYILNLQAAIWEKNFLLNLIGCENYNAWTFELNNMFLQNIDSSKLDYVIDDRNILHIVHGVLQSKYLPYAVKKCKQIGHNINNGSRTVLSIKDNFIYQLKLFFASVTPNRLKEPIKRLARCLNFTFVADKYKKRVK